MLYLLSYPDKQLELEYTVYREKSAISPPIPDIQLELEYTVYKEKYAVSPILP